MQVLLVEARGLTLSEIGFVYGLYGLVIVVLEVPTGGLADTVGRKRVMLAALLVTLLSQIVLLFAFSLPLFLLFAALSGVGRALLSGAPEAWFIDTLQGADPKVDVQRALAQGNAFELFALAVGTLLSGFIPTLFTHLPPDGSGVLTPLSMTVLASASGFVVTFLAVAGLVEEPPGVREAGVSGLGALERTITQAVTSSRRNPIILSLFGAAAAGGFALSGLETFW